MCAHPSGLTFLFGSQKPMPPKIGLPLYSAAKGTFSETFCWTDGIMHGMERLSGY